MFSTELHYAYNIVPCTWSKNSQIVSPIILLLLLPNSNLNRKLKNNEFNTLLNTKFFKSLKLLSNVWYKNNDSICKKILRKLINYSVTLLNK